MKPNDLLSIFPSEMHHFKILTLWFQNKSEHGSEFAHCAAVEVRDETTGNDSQFGPKKIIDFELFIEHCSWGLRLCYLLALPAVQ